MKTSYLTVQAITFPAVNSVSKSHSFYCFHTTNSLLLSATCSVHRAKQTAVQHKHTLSFHREAGDKNHPTIHEYKDTFNKGSDSIYSLISCALYIFSVIKRQLHWWWEVTYGSQTDCWNKLTSSSKFGTFISSDNWAHTGLWSLRLLLSKQTRILVRSRFSEWECLFWHHDHLFRLDRQT